MPNRLIIDNTTVAFKLLHHMSNRRIGKKGHMEWGFLQRIMLKIGLPNQWVNQAMETVCTTSYSAHINGGAKGFITPTSAIKQGDPFSPYLFLLCVEGLSSLIR